MRTRDDGRAWLSVAAVIGSVAWAGNEFTPLLVMYQLHSGFTTLEVNVLFGAYVLGIIPALLVGGPVADRVGRRPVLVPAPLLAMAGSLALALFPGSLAALLVGRLLCGAALGLAMAVGSTWIKELSQAPWDPTADAGAGARRAATTLSLGFGTGALVAGVIAQWGPAPTLLPYLVTIGVIAPAMAWMLRRAPETQRRAVLSTAHSRSRSRFALLAEEGVDPRVRRQFLLVVAPAAPWVFGCAGTAYAILPTQLRPAASGLEIAYSTLTCVVGLGFGVGVQPLVRRLDRAGGRHMLVAGLGVAVLGMLLAAFALAAPGADGAGSTATALWRGVIAAAVLGTGYGTLLVSGLQIVQRIAPPGRLAAFTAVYYGLTYLGFFMPAVLSAITLATPATHPGLMVTGAVLALVTGAWVWVASARLRTVPTPAEPRAEAEPQPA